MHFPEKKKTSKFVENSIKIGIYWINFSKENVHFSVYITRRFTYLYTFRITLKYDFLDGETLRIAE